MLLLYIIERFLRERALAKYFYLDEDKDNLVVSKLRCCDEAHLLYPCCHLVKQAAACIDASPTLHNGLENNRCGSGTETDARAKPTHIMTMSHRYK